MSHDFFTSVSVAGSGFGPGDAWLALRVALTCARDRRWRRRAERELRSLPEPSLRDLGIGRSEIGAAVRRGRDIDARSE